jgi:hypothetical protein
MERLIARLNPISLSMASLLSLGAACFSSSSPGSPAAPGVSLDGGVDGGAEDGASSDAGGGPQVDVGVGSAAGDAGGGTDSAAGDAGGGTDAAPGDAGGGTVDAGGDDSGGSGSCKLGSDPGKIYVADFANNRVDRADDMCGDNWASLGGISGGAGVAQFQGPQSIATDAMGKIYVADTFNDRVVRMDDMTGTNWTTFGAAGSGTDQFQQPRAIFIDGGGHIFVADSGNQRLVRMDDMTGANWATFGAAGTGVSQFTALWGLFVDTAGRIYITDTDRSAQFAVARLVRIDDMAGTNWTTFGAPGSGTNQLANPWGVSVDATGHIYIADTSNQRIVRIDDMTGTNWTTLGTLGNGVGHFFAPSGIFVGSGRIYVLDEGSTGFPNDSHVVRMDDMAGTNWTSLGTLGAGRDNFTQATAVWIH